MPQEIVVRNVVGRYPYGPAIFRSENTVASVSELGRIYRIRLEDAENPDAWTEITVEVFGDEIIFAEPIEEPSHSEDIPF